MSLREEIAEAIDDPKLAWSRNRADAALRCVERWLAGKQKTSNFFIEGEWAIDALRKELAEMVKEARNG